MRVTQRRKLMGVLVVAVTGSVLLAGVPVSTAGAVGGVSASDPVPVTTGQAHTAAGSGIKVTHATFVDDKHRVTATVV